MHKRLAHIPAEVREKSTLHSFQDSALASPPKASPPKEANDVNTSTDRAWESFFEARYTKRKDSLNQSDEWTALAQERSQIHAKKENLQELTQLLRTALGTDLGSVTSYSSLEKKLQDSQIQQAPALRCSTPTHPEAPSLFIPSPVVSPAHSRSGSTSPGLRHPDMAEYDSLNTIIAFVSKACAEKMDIRFETITQIQSLLTSMIKMEKEHCIDTAINEKDSDLLSQLLNSQPNSIEFYLTLKQTMDRLLTLASSTPKDSPRQTHLQDTKDLFMTKFHQQSISSSDQYVLNVIANTITKFGNQPPTFYL